MVLLGIGQASQHVLQVVLDHQMMTMRTADHTVHLQSPRRRTGMAKEHPVVAADSQRPKDLFRLVVVNRNSPVAEIHSSAPTTGSAGSPTLCRSRSAAARAARRRRPANAACGSTSAPRRAAAVPHARRHPASCPVLRRRTTGGRTRAPATRGPDRSTQPRRIRTAHGHYSSHGRSARRNVPATAIGAAGVAHEDAAIVARRPSISAFWCVSDQ